MLTRRTFVAWTATAIPLALVTRRAEALGATWIAGETEVLNTIAEAVLPSELDADARARVVHSFQAWISEYKEGAELTHGYGTSALRVTRPSPRAKWSAQLERLGNRKIESLSVAERRAVIREELGNTTGGGMPSLVTAPHVTLALLSFYYGLPEAADLCYNAQIGRQTCRPLSQSSRKPLPLAGRS